MDDVTLFDMVQNGTMDAAVAATLWTIGEERRSFLTVAVPRLAGKTTVARAMLQFAPPDTVVHELSGELDEMARLRAAPDGGYLFVDEFARGGQSHYIWGEPVRRVFQTVQAGFSLATSLHASSLWEAFRLICEENGVPDDDASRIDYVVYLVRMGDEEHGYRRRVAAVYEVERVEDGVPHARLLHRWRAEEDTFDRMEAPRLLTAGTARLRQHAAHIRRTVDRQRSTAAGAGVEAAAAS